MTINAAGILFIAPDKSTLFLKRGPGGDYPGMWCFPGGKEEDDETPEQTALREAREEVGKLPKGELIYWTRSVSVGASPPAPVGNDLNDNNVAQGGMPGQAAPGEQVDFTTFLQRVDERFEPQRDGEHVGFAWAPADQPPEPLHPGCRIALDRFGMDELGFARAMAEGRLTSPQKYENVWLFAIRITGTGVAYRNKVKEFVWRDPALYMTQEFLDRCNGLPVILLHPEGGSLDSQEFNERSVGSVFLPYLKPEANEVWAIAKIYDEPTAEILQKKQFSTSPAVVFRDPSVNNKFEMENGSKLLMEGKPTLLDHIAICYQGVWDKGGEPAGVQVDGLVVADGMLPDRKTDKLKRIAVKTQVIAAVQKCEALRVPWN